MVKMPLQMERAGYVEVWEGVRLNMFEKYPTQLLLLLPLKLEEVVVEKAGLLQQ
jgi:hypothetical protein